MDLLLRYTRDFPLAIVEAKAAYKSAADGLQRPKQYAEVLGLKFAYVTNGREIIEYDIDTKTKKGIRDMALEWFPVSRNRKDSLVDLHGLEPCWLTHEWRAV